MEKPLAPDPYSLPSDKPALRRIMETRRGAAFAENPQAAYALRDRFLKALSLPSGATVASYSARGSEIDPAPLAEALFAAGHKIALPVMTEKGQPLRFREFSPGMPLIMNALGIAEPDAEAAFVEPDVLLVPLLAFDSTRARLGTGGGYYDRTLADLRRRKTIFTVGLAFSCQEIGKIPVESHDVPLDRIATELKVF